ncbi:pseudouridine synthase [Fulvimarina endophytica]|uniref:Pseudouridine synthase n=1 Tax=Fulvimarina endophytica TaxID=2293836 RepID=A0A371X827_9HYPH|nr:pseudouridine synthase [Fulvimarina endophytica]RFC65348.1 pseudouridine synthase [Fulvimarina endophytica]
MSDDDKSKRSGGRGPGGFKRGGSGEGGQKPFTPKSRGMKSHGGARDGEAPRKPKSFGTRSAERMSDGERPARPKASADRPRGENREWDGRGERKTGFKPGGRRPDAGGDGERRGPRGGFTRNDRERTDGERPERSERPERGARPPRAAFGEKRSQGAGRRDDRREARSASGGTERRSRHPVEDASSVSAQASDMRIARRLARAGIASRRDAEGMIADGRVKVNGKVIDSPALDVHPTDRIEVDNAPLPQAERTRLWLFHKPAGTVTTNKDPEGRRTIFDRLPDDMPRVLSIGRLDINTEGLLLLTNDGGLSRVLELPSTGWLRRYRVRAHGAVTQARLDELRNGISVDGVFYGAMEATLDREQGSNVWITLGLREGKNREVKNVLGALGLDVNRLIRLSFGPFQLGDLEEGAVREVKGRTLRDQLGDRLIEEAGADFDGPISQPFSNKPVEGRKEREAAPKTDWVSAGGPVNRKKFGEKKREDALGRLDTKPKGRFGDRDKAGRDRDGGERGRGDRERGGRSFGADKRGSGGDRPGKFGKTDDFADKKPMGEGRRRSNVWMAPDSKPWRDKPEGERTGEARGSRDLANPARRVSRPPKVAGSKFAGKGGKPASGGKPPRSSGPASGSGSGGRPQRTGGPRREGAAPRPRDRKPSDRDES